MTVIERLCRERQQRFPDVLVRLDEHERRRSFLLASELQTDARRLIYGCDL